MEFENRLAAIEWIAAFAEDEGQFEVLREQLNFNHIYTGRFFLQIEDKKSLPEVILLGK